MKKNIHLPSKLSRILCAIEDERLGLDSDAYLDACVDYSAHGLDMPDSLAEYHIRALENRFPTVDWQNERQYNAQFDHQPLYDDRG
jgi:hypothetical protein